MNKNKFLNCKSQSEIIGTVLLVLIVIIAAVALISFIMPFVKNQFSGTDCFEVSDKIEIKENPTYTCFKDNADSVLDQMIIQIHVRDTQDKIKGFAIELGGASSKAIDIIEDSTLQGVYMYDDSSALEIPNKNEDRTYKIDTAQKPEYVKVYPILKNGKNCDKSSSINSIPTCS